MTNYSISDDLDFALRLADIADKCTFTYFQRSELQVENKLDGTLVSEADRETEEHLREFISLERPDDTIFGEEGEALKIAAGQEAADPKPLDSGRRWIIDPIDGTNNFIRGVPVWASLIGLEIDGKMVVGVVSAPALGRRWWAGRGEGAFMRTALPGVGNNELIANSDSNGSVTRPISVSDISILNDASLSYSSLHGWKAIGYERAFLDLTNSVWRSRAYGDFWSYMLVAEGAVDIACEPDLELYDMAALVPIIEEAGGKFSDINGHDGPWGPNALATNGIIHDEVLQCLRNDLYRE